MATMTQEEMIQAICNQIVLLHNNNDQLQDRVDKMQIAMIKLVEDVKMKTELITTLVKNQKDVSELLMKFNETTRD